MKLKIILISLAIFFSCYNRPEPYSIGFYKDSYKECRKYVKDLIELIEQCEEDREECLKRGTSFEHCP